MQESFRLAQHHLLRALLAELGSDAGLANDDAAVDAGDQTHACAIDHVVAVGGLLLLPQRLWHDAEHEPAVGLPPARHQKVKLEVAQLHSTTMLREMPAAAIRTNKLSKDYGLGRGLF